MGFPSLLALFLFLFFNVLSVSVGQENTDDLSAISFTLCEDFTGDVNFQIKVRAKDKQGQKGETLSTRFTGTTRQKTLEGKIEQTNVKDVKIISTQEICFQALVVDTTIVIDQPTNFKASCPTEAVEADSLPCKEFKSRVKPVLICPQALTELLKEKGVIVNEPSQRPGPNSFETPTYDITNDMRQASLVIVSGLTEEFNKVVKNRINVLSSAKKVNFADIGKNLGSFSSFLSALGPMFSIFGGITTIITTFLTPNPFEQMVQYLEKEFDEVHRRLTYIQTDIADLKKVVQSANNIVAMAPAMKAIRYTLRAYEPMVKSLSNAPVCGSRNLLRRPEVVTFMEQYKKDRVENSLKDLYGMDFGEVLEASSLLKSFMRAYCGTNVAKVQRFMQEISNYAYAGSMAHFAHRSLQCRLPKKDRPTNCKTDEAEKEKWMKKLYRFLKKANAMKEGAVYPAHGLQLDMQPDLNQLILDEVKKATNKMEFPGVLDKVYDFIIKKLYDINDWPEACIVNLKEDSVVIIQVAQLLSKVTEYGYDFKPWALGYKYTGAGLEKSKFKVKNVGRGFRLKLVTDPMKFQPLYTEGEKSCHCQDGPKVKESCNVTKWQYSLQKIDYYKDRILYFLFNPLSYLISTDPTSAKFIRHTPIVVSNIVPVCAFYKERSFMKNFCYDAEVVIACLHYLKMHEVDGKRNWYDMKCIGPDAKDPNRPQSWPEWEKYIAIVAE